MEFDLYNRIEDVDEGLWDGLVGKQVFSHHRLIRVLQDSLPPQVIMKHLILRHQGLPVGCTSFFSHPFDLDILAPNWFKKSHERFSLPNFDVLKQQIIFCGLPISIGKSHLYLMPEVQANCFQEAWNMIHAAMAQVARNHNISLLGFKEFDRRGLAPLVRRCAQTADYVHCHSLATVTLNLPFQDFSGYLNGLRSSYRRQILADMKLLAGKLVTWQSLPLGAMDPDVVWQLYYNVWSRSKNRLEQLTPAFFKHLGVAYPQSARVILGYQDGQVIACAIVFVEQRQATFMFAGLEYRHVHPLGIYRNLLIQMVQLSLAWGTRRLELGQTSYDVKSRLGGVMRPLTFFLKHQNPLLHFSLKQLSPLLFPKVKHVQRKVFRQDQDFSSSGFATPQGLFDVSPAVVSRGPELESITTC